MERKYIILKAIIESFIVSAEPIGSKFLLGSTELDVSPATIRNDMANLEKMGLIYQPYTSAGRIPTTKGFRMYVDDLMGEMHAAAMQQRGIVKNVIEKKASEDKIYQSVSLLSRTCANVSFATIPHLKKSYFLGLSNMLQSPEFQRSIEAYTVIKILEDSDQFIDLLSDLAIDDTTKVFIGEENIIPEIQSCSLIATSFELPELGRGVIGILGPKRMNYAFNMASLEIVKNSLY